MYVQLCKNDAYTPSTHKHRLIIHVINEYRFCQELGNSYFCLLRSAGDGFLYIFTVSYGVKDLPRGDAGVSLVS